MAFQFKNSSLALISLFIVIMSLLCSSSASAESSGTATYYTPPYVPSACYGFEDEGVMIAALSEGLFNGGAACGQYYQVTCVSGTNQGTPHPCLGNGPVTVRIVDKCPAGSCRGTIDLSQEAFASIADTASGSINIDFQQVEDTSHRLVRSSVNCIQ
ncbi:hypothetical protein Dsin_006936 [Dipteronia sinensis]|uniref:Expansin-like EG45 domain-containing protein n=1 Tax=Dipteronia sinensis TaxID=43782 RepID=A0AAE0B0W5_9ROSI|nr:hypothetical protein Dsin_006936 [Dipteronia sinensis]